MFGCVLREQKRRSLNPICFALLQEAADYMRSSQIPLLLEWCEQNEIWIDPSLQLHDDTHTGIGVFTSDVIQNRATGVESI